MGQENILSVKTEDTHRVAISMWEEEQVQLELLDYTCMYVGLHTYILSERWPHIIPLPFTDPKVIQNEYKVGNSSVAKHDM
jgi:hypothetical protein